MHDSIFNAIFGSGSFGIPEISFGPVEVSQVIFNPPATIVYWSDGTKTVAMCSEQDTFNEEFGFAMACAKKLLHPYEKFQAHIENAYRPYLKKSKAPKEKDAPCTCDSCDEHMSELTTPKDIYDFLKQRGFHGKLEILID